MLTPEQEFKLIQIRNRIQAQPTESIKAELNGLMRMLMLQHSAMQAQLRLQWGIGSPRPPER